MEGLFDKVKASVSAEAYMENLGEEGKRSGQGMRYNFCPVCSARSNLVFNVKCNGSCHCFECNFTGSVIDVHASAINKDPVSAAKDLADKFGIGVPSAGCKVIWKRPDAVLEAKKSSERQDALREALRRIHQAINKRLEINPCPSARRYLTNDRCIATDVVAMAEQRGLVGYLPANPNEAQALLDEAVGRDLLIKSGLMKPESTKAAIAFRPLVFFMPADLGAEFRLIRTPKDKEPKSIRYGELKFPYWWQGNSDSVVVVEGAIDLLSLVSLGQSSTIIALPGCQSWKADWFGRIQNKYDTKQFVLALDNDVAGDESSTMIACELDRAGITHFRLHTENGCKDWNDALKVSLNESVLKVAA